MKKLNVLVQNKTTLVLDEDGNKGDLIDLQNLTNIDFSNIESLIDQGKDKVYLKKLEEATKRLEEQNAANLKIKLAEKKDQYLEEIANLKKDLEKQETKKDLEISELKLKLENEQNKEKEALNLKITELNSEIIKLKAEKDQEVKETKLTKENEIVLLKEQINSLKENNQLIIDARIKENDLKCEKELSKLKEEHNTLMEKKNQEYKELEESFNALQRQRASLNVKQTGEDLEAWCDNEVKSYMQNGLFNCTWYKDNDVVKEIGENKGSKADFIFKVYADNKHDENQLLTSICLDMKDENPDSVNKKTNADYYKQLDKNRTKKNCKYACLVSNLEMDKPNDLPMFKVQEYPDMYVVRPAYLMTFLNLMTSLTTRFVDLILSKQEKEFEILAEVQFTEEFDKLKKTYLDNPLGTLENQVKDIDKKTETIIQAADNIHKDCTKIIEGYLSNIINKLDKFSEGIRKAYKKMNN